jgi:hypothetical protein
MKIFDGLFLYEVVLLILGTLFFIALLVILIIKVAQNRSIKPLLLFFAVPIVMIGFPALGKVKFDKSGIELDKLTKEVAENPSNPELQTKLKDAVAAAGPRAAESQEGLVKVARAEAVLGNQEKAEQTVNKALRVNPNLVAAKDLKTRLADVPRSNDARLREAVVANIATTSAKK